MPKNIEALLVVKYSKFVKRENSIEQYFFKRLIKLKK